jgi:hypothetical protein
LEEPVFPDILRTQNPYVLKLPLLLSQFLYQTRKLDLPGIGSFVLDPNAVIPEASDRHPQTPASGISFKNATISVPDEALIQFIKEHTGKMKPLAAADLDFFLTTGKQLLNVGKPFYLEGIGTLIKNNEGKFDFTPGEYATIKLEDMAAEKKKIATQNFEEPPREYEPPSNNVRQGLLLLALIAGLIAIGWGGYYLYKRNNFVEPLPEKKTVINQDTTPAQTDTSGAQSGAQGTTSFAAKPADSTRQTTAAVQVAPPGSTLYKFVILETDRKGRALRRYNQLLGFQLNIKMDQKDSAYFKLYFPIVATIRDTTHIKDSLADVYAAHVTIEQ